MSRNGSGVYSAPPGTLATTQTTIESAKYNAFVNDLVSDLNGARPITAGGTGKTNASDARTALGLEIGTDVQAYDAELGKVGNKGTAIASAASIDLGAATGDYVHITGTTTITAMGTADAGTKRRVVFDGALTLTHNATSLILFGADITTAAGDVAVFVSEGSGNWRCTAYQRADGAVATDLVPDADSTRDLGSSSKAWAEVYADKVLTGQVAFPATQNASTDANTLDDYLEDTYTPVAVGGISAGTGTYAAQVGRYTKIGNVVHFAVDMEWTAHTGTGGIEITLPVAPSTSAAVPFAVTTNNLTVSTGKFIGAQINKTTSRIALVETPTGGGGLQGISMDTAATVRIAGMYFV